METTETQRIEVLETEMKDVKSHMAHLSLEFRVHEAQCAERWKHNQEMLSRIENSVDAGKDSSNAKFGRIEKMLLSIAGALIIGGLTFVLTGGVTI